MAMCMYAFCRGSYFQYGSVNIYSNPGCGDHKFVLRKIGRPLFLPGGYMTGTSTLEVYDADILVAETGMIVCSMQVDYINLFIIVSVAMA